MRIVQEAEDVKGRLVLIIALLALIATAIGVLVAWQLMLTTRRPIHAPPGFQARRGSSAPAEVNGIEMTPFPAMSAGPRGQSAAAEAQPLPAGSALLEQYGWSDRDRQIVYVPIDRAKELYLSRRARSVRAEVPAREGVRP